MRYLKALIIIILFFLSMLFFIQNTEVMSQPMTLHMDFFLAGLQFKTLPLPLMAFLIGALATLSYFFMERVKLAQRVRECNHKIARLEQEVNSLRNLPLEKSLQTTGESDSAIAGTS